MVSIFMADWRGACLPAYEMLYFGANVFDRIAGQEPVGLRVIVASRWGTESKIA
jgi:hypothetical protein